MKIDVDLLLSWGGIIKAYKKKEIIFREDSLPQYFFQIISGKIAMYNTSEDGKEFYQGLFGDNESFGEPPLFIDKPYPSTAIAYKDTVVIRLPKNNFFELLQSSSELQQNFIKLFANRIYNKANASKILIVNDAEERVVEFLESFKKSAGSIKQKILVPQTRQEIANMIGLRVETVIRTLTKLQHANKVQIIDHKLYY